MRKMKKTLALLAVLAMVLTMIPVQVFAADTDSTRLAGADRIGTAIAIADAFGDADTVILAAADNANLVDSLAVAPLAGKVSPIYLTFKDSLNADVKAKLAGKKVIAIGAVSDAVVADAQTVATSVEKVSGADRLATNDLINAKLTDPAGTFVVGYNAIPDALSVASFAAANNYAIVLANLDGSVDSAKIKGSTTYILGGPTLVSDITGATRLYGPNRFDTNTEVVKALTFTYDNVYVANGLTLVDALAGSSLAAKTGAPILLTDNATVKAAGEIQDKLTSATKVIALGGTGVVSDSVLDSVIETPEEFDVKSVSATSLIQLNVELTNDNYLDKDELEDADNYDFEGIVDDDLESIDIAEAEVEGTTLTLTLEEAVDNQTTGNLVIDSAVTGEELTFNDIEFDDSTLPTVEDIKVIGKDTVKVTFSEPMQNLAAMDDEFEFEDEDGNEFDVDEVTSVNNGIEANIEVFGTFEEGTLTVSVGNGLEDYAGYNLYSVTKEVEVVEDTTAPVVTGFKEASRDEVTLIFDEDIQFEDKDEENYYNTNDDDTVDTGSVDDTDIDGNELTLSFETNNLPEGTGYVYIKSGSVSNLWDVENEFIKVAVTVVEDVTDPTVKKVKYEDGVITVTFTEDVDEDTAEDLDNYLVEDPDGDEADIRDAVRDEDDNDTVELTFRDDVADLDEGDYTLTVENVEDEAGNEIAKVTVDFTVGDSQNPEVPDEVYYETDGDEVKVYIEYGEKMATDGSYSAVDLTKYSLNLDGVAAAVDLGDEDNIDDYDIDIKAMDGNKTVKITMDSAIFDGTDIDLATLTVSRVADAEGNRTTLAEKTANFVDYSTATVAILAADVIAKEKDKIEVTFPTAFDDINESDFIVYIESGATAGFQSAEDDRLTIEDIDELDSDTINIILDEDDDLPADADDCKLGTIPSPTSETASGRTLQGNLALTITDEIDPAIIEDDDQDINAYAPGTAGSKDDIARVYAEYNPVADESYITLEFDEDLANVGNSTFRVNGGDNLVTNADETAGDGTVILTVNGEVLRGDDIVAAILYDANGNYAEDLTLQIEYKVAAVALNDGTDFAVTDGGGAVNGVTFTDNATTAVDTLDFTGLGEVASVRVTIGSNTYTGTVSALGAVTIDIGDNNTGASVDADVVLVTDGGVRSAATTITLNAAGADLL